MHPSLHTCPAICQIRNKRSFLQKRVNELQTKTKIQQTRRTDGRCSRKDRKGSLSQRDKSITMRPGNPLNKGLRALRGKNGPFRKWFISAYVVAYVILITKKGL